ncbi:MAG: hypothetical protein FRX49_07840 [Trebouxia sp. A1-2]|nr:MAG: hypothetical protein FRX49_07840 [Trebouxia sp. A1-2]
MSRGFRVAAARQASTGSSESCQDCFQYCRQSLMENKGYCEDTREDLVPPKAKRQKVCSQAFQGKSTAYHRGRRRADLDVGNALHPYEHVAEGKSCELQASNSRVQLSLLAQARVAEADAMQKLHIVIKCISLFINARAIAFNTPTAQRLEIGQGLNGIFSKAVCCNRQR